MICEHEKHLEYVSITALFVLIGLMLVVTPNLDVKIGDFFKDLQQVEAYPNIFLPGPTHHHPILYDAVFRFCYLYTSTLVCVLVLRLVARSPLYKKVRCAIVIVFWSTLGVPTFLLREEAIPWFGHFGRDYFSSFLLLSIGSIVSIFGVYYALGKKATIESVVLNYIKKHESKIRISECAKELGITNAEVKEAISLLQKKGLIETSG